MAPKLTLRRLYLWLASALMLWCIAIGAGLWALNWLQTPLNLTEAQRELTLVKGQSAADIAQVLAENHQLAHPWLWRTYLQLVGNKPLQAGEYRFAEQPSPVDMAQQLQRGEVILRSVTFAEGLRLKDWLAILAQHPKLKQEVANTSDAELKKKLDFGYDSLEGWFFPDTYSYQAGDSDLDILRRAHKKMQNTLERLWRQRQEGLPYASPLEALTMASIVEKETGMASERPEIAGVFVRRLRKNMRLQTDPTVIYGLGDAYTGNLTSKHLQTPTPYNTYTQNGLPPSPIANPGAAAIAAALSPAAGDALYFVAKGDGSHVFSSSLQQHNQAVERFQRSGRREDYRASPAP